MKWFMNHSFEYWWFILFSYQLIRFSFEWIHMIWNMERMESIYKHDRLNWYEIKWSISMIQQIIVFWISILSSCLLIILFQLILDNRIIFQMMECQSNWNEWSLSFEMEMDRHHFESFIIPFISITYYIPYFYTINYQFHILYLNWE